MLKTIRCKNCGKPFHYLAVLNSLPTRLRCSHCNSVNSFEHGHLFALAFYLSWLVSVLILFSVYGNIDIEHSPSHLHSLLIFSVFLGGALLATVILSLIYLKALEKWSRLDIRNQ